MATKYPNCDIEELWEIGSIVGYMARGHHDTEAFMAVLADQWWKQTDPTEVHQTYWRLLPPDADGDQWYQPSLPGRGAFPVTFTHYAIDIPQEKVATHD